MGMDNSLKKSLVEYITGRRGELTLEGPPLTLALVYETAQASRALYVALEKGNIELISSALTKKKEAVQRWEKTTGSAWGL